MFVNPEFLLCYFFPDNFKLWTNHPVLGVAKISFTLAVGLGFALTAWLHLLYLPRLQKMPFFGLIGIILSFCEGAPQL